MINIFIPRFKKNIINIKGKIRCIMKRHGQVTFDKIFPNRVAFLGTDSILSRMCGDGSHAEEGKITYGAVGTDNGTITPFSTSNTQLGAELARVTLTTALHSEAAGEFTFDFGLASANGNLQEAGLFGEGATGTANSGVLFERGNISVTKTSLDTLTIVIGISFYPVPYD